MYQNPTSQHDTAKVSELISETKIKKFGIEPESTASRSLQSGSSKSWKVDDMWPETYLTKRWRGYMVEQFA